MSTHCGICNRRSILSPSGFTLVELLIVIAVIGIISAISIPAMLRARRTANEAAAIGSLRALNSAESSYASAAAKGGFSPLLATLAAPCPGSSLGFISPDLSIDPAVKSGYTITLAASASSSPGPTDCNGVVTVTSYYVTGVPVAAGLSGLRGFATTGAGTIFFDQTGVAPTEAQMAPGGGGTTIQ
jgi:prepilin-type N-terminal cleavage/methylation domain-containing protein